MHSGGAMRAAFATKRFGGDELVRGERRKLLRAHEQKLKRMPAIVDLMYRFALVRRLGVG